MITSQIHGQFEWFYMRLRSDIRAKMNPLWRGGLLVSLMDVHLHASEENGCGRGTIGLKRVTTACPE
jgi:hypothetical protein